MAWAPSSWSQSGMRIYVRHETAEQMEALWIKRKHQALFDSPCKREEHQMPRSRFVSISADAGFIKWMLTARVNPPASLACWPQVPEMRGSNRGRQSQGENLRPESYQELLRSLFWPKYHGIAPVMIPGEVHKTLIVQCNIHLSGQKWNLQFVLTERLFHCL